jgi:hypothetical protein
MYLLENNAVSADFSTTALLEVIFKKPRRIRTPFSSKCEKDCDVSSRDRSYPAQLQEDSARQDENHKSCRLSTNPRRLRGLVIENLHAKALSEKG